MMGLKSWIDSYSLLADGLGLQDARGDDAAMVETNGDARLGLGGHLDFCKLVTPVHGLYFTNPPWPH